MTPSVTSSNCVNRAWTSGVRANASAVKGQRRALLSGQHLMTSRYSTLPVKPAFCSVARTAALSRPLPVIFTSFIAPLPL